MKIRFTAIFLAVLAFVSGQVNSQVVYDWHHFYDGGLEDHGLVFSRTDKNFNFIMGTTEDFDGYKVHIRKYHSDGSLVYSAGGDTYLSGSVLFMKADNQQNVYVITENLPINGYSIYKYDPTGIQIWKRNFTERPVGLEIGANKVYTGGQAQAGFFARCYRSADGQTVWARKDDRGREAAAMDLDLNENVIVGGVDGGASGYQINDNVRIVKFGISSTTPIWTKNFNGSSNLRDNVCLLQTDAIGNIYIAGEVNASGSSGANICLTKFNSHGIRQWTEFITDAGGSVTAYPVKILFDPNREPVLVGGKIDHYNISPVNETSRMFVSKHNRHNGDVLFYTYPNDNGFTDQTLYETPTAATIDQFGHIYVGGFGNNWLNQSGHRWTVTKIHGEYGFSPWIQTAHTPLPFDRVNDIYVSDVGSVYIANTSGGYVPDMMLVKMTQTDNGAKMEIDHKSELISLNVFPNPSATNFNISTVDKNAIARVYDLTGKMVEQFNVSEKSEFGSEYRKGLYLLRVEGTYGEAVFKMIKE